MFGCVVFVLGGRGEEKGGGEMWPSYDKEGVN